jgi:hypothetical protein
MTIKDHTTITPETVDAAAIREAITAAVTLMVNRLREARIDDAVFMLSLIRASEAEPFANVRMASNMPPDIAREFIEILAAHPGRLRASNDEPEVPLQ